MNKIERIVNMIEADEDNINVLSSGEQIAAALLFNRMDWLPEEYKHPLDAIDRIGEDWFHMVMDYRRNHS